MEDEMVVLERVCSELRGKIEVIKKEVLSNKAMCIAGVFDTVDKGEVLANLTLAYRHLEDARMRIGKTMQALQGGVSILDK